MGLGAVLLVAMLGGHGCGSIGYSAKETWPDNVGYRAPATDAIVLRWVKPLVPVYEGPYKPVEGAVPVLSPMEDRVYLGTSSGHFWALSGGGKRIYQYNTLATIEAEAGLDRNADEVYVGTEDGVLHALVASQGTLRWRSKVRGPLRQPPVIAETLIFVVTDDDEVVALDRRSGKRVWSYHRDAPEGFTIAGHAGLVLSQDLLITAFSDGVVVAFEPKTGKVAWERDTSIEIEQAPDAPQRFGDVDTTPVVDGDTIYIASFSGGLFELSRSSGSIEWHRSDWTGVTGLAMNNDVLVLSSADLGVLCMDRRQRTLRWHYRMQRGAPSRAVILPGRVVVAESRGALLALSLNDGRELSRIESKQGFAASMATADHRGYILSNSGELFAFAL